MKQLGKDKQAFFALVRAGLWEKGVRLSPYKDIDYSAIMRLAEELSVVGLVAAGLEHVSDVKVPQQWALQFAGQTIQLEQRNKDMDAFIAKLIEKLRNEDIYTLLVKGQGIAQCYERPLWRTCGDVDLLLSEDNYNKAKYYLASLALSTEKENREVKHFAMNIDGWSVELHGTLRSCTLRQMDKLIDEAQNDILCGGNVRSWQNAGTLVFLPSVDNDVVLIFTHILKHFYHGGIGLRQICDWCRLLWVYRESLNSRLLEERIQKAGLMSEWKSLAALAVDYLGMPDEAMPLYSVAPRWSRKAKKILGFVIKTGNFGHNRDLSYYQTKPLLQRKLISFWRQTSDGIYHFSVFPLDSLKVWGRMVTRGLLAVLQAEKHE